MAVIDSAMMKEEIKEKLRRPQYDVRDFYAQRGVFQAVARSEGLQICMSVVILAYVVWAAIDIDHNEADSPADASLIFQIVPYSFAAIFCIELFIRFMAFGRKKDAFRDSDTLSDGVLAPLMFLDPWVPMLRVLQISIRMNRIWRHIPEMMIIFKGLGTAGRSVFYCLCMYCFLTYAFALALCILLSETTVGDEYFSTVLESMHSLLVHAIFFGAYKSPLNEMNEVKPIAEVFFVIFIFLNWTMLVLTLGVTCEVVSVVAAVEKEQLTMKWMLDKVGSFYNELDIDDAGMIKQQGFKSFLENAEFVEMLQGVDIDVIRLIDAYDIVFNDQDDQGEFGLSITDFLEVLLNFRSTNKATMKDMVDLRKHIMSSQSDSAAKVMKDVKPLSRRLAKIEDGLKELLNKKKKPSISNNLTNAPDEDIEDV